MSSSNNQGEHNLDLLHDSSAALTTAKAKATATATAIATASATSAGPAVTRNPLQSGSPGRKGGVESEDRPGTAADHDDGRTRHTASEGGSSERKGHENEMNEQRRRLYGTQQLHQLHPELDTSCRVVGPRTSVSGALDVASGVAGSSACGTLNTTGGTERRLPKIILKVRPPPPPGGGAG